MRWVTITQASKELNVPHSKISRMARKNEIKSESDPLNARVRLVDIDEIRALVEKRNQLLGKSSAQDKDPSEQVEDTL